MTLRIIPCSRTEAAGFIAMHHRHHKPPAGDLFRLACVDSDGVVRGVLTAGRPVARMLDDGWTVEITRVATDGTRNACSLLYGAARRVAWSRGFRRMFTYTLPEEGGASLRAAGWVEDGAAGGGEWSRAARPRDQAERADVKTRWSCENPRAHTGEVFWPEQEGPAEPPQCRLFGAPYG